MRQGSTKSIQFARVRVLTVTALAVAVLIVAVLTVAQLAGASRSTAAEPVNHWTVLNRVAACRLAAAVEVQKDVELTPKQTRQMHQLSDRWQKRRREIMRAKPEDLLEIDKQLTKEVGVVVSPPQWKRLQQIAWQCAGVANVVVQHAKSDALFGLTRQQRADVLAVELKYQRAFGKESVQAIHAGPRKSTHDRPAIVKLRQQREEDVFKALSDDQRETWQKLRGKPFVGSLADKQGKRTHTKVISLP